MNLQTNWKEGLKRIYPRDTDLSDTNMSFKTYSAGIATGTISGGFFEVMMIVWALNVKIYLQFDGNITCFDPQNTATEACVILRYRNHYNWEVIAWNG